MIAFTNHALDHMLSSVLEADITKKIVRLGSRSADELISPFSLENLEKVAGRSRLHRAFAGIHRDLKKCEEDVKAFMKEHLKTSPESQSILDFVEIVYPESHQHFADPPAWIGVLYRAHISTADSQWQRVGKGGKDEAMDNTIYEFWRSGGDLEF